MSTIKLCASPQRQTARAVLRPSMRLTGAVFDPPVRRGPIKVRRLPSIVRKRMLEPTVGCDYDAISGTALGIDHAVDRRSNCSD